MLHQGSAIGQVPAVVARSFHVTLKDHKKDVAYHEYPERKTRFLIWRAFRRNEKTLSFFDKG